MTCEREREHESRRVEKGNEFGKAMKHKLFKRQEQVLKKRLSFKNTLKIAEAKAIHSCAGK